METENNNEIESNEPEPIAVENTLEVVGGSIEEEKPISNSEEIVRNEKGQLQKGVVLNPNGRPKGSRDFATDFDEAVDEIAKEEGITKSQARKLLFKTAYMNARDGNYSFYKDIHDRVYGQATQKQELSGGLKLDINPEEKKIIEKAIDEVL